MDCRIWQYPCLGTCTKFQKLFQVPCNAFITTNRFVLPDLLCVRLRLSSFVWLGVVLVKCFSLLYKIWLIKVNLSHLDCCSYQALAALKFGDCVYYCAKFQLCVPLLVRTSEPRFSDYILGLPFLRWKDYKQVPFFLLCLHHSPAWCCCSKIIFSQEQNAKVVMYMNHYGSLQHQMKRL